MSFIYKFIIETHVFEESQFRKIKKDVEIKVMKSSEAEVVKIFVNTYLALRIVFFNELDKPFANQDRVRKL